MAEPQTMVVPGEGSSVLAYPLPANVLQYVESVVAVIDNSSGGDATPVLSIATGGGTPIADKEQGRAIPGGDKGRATWAHRLTDEQQAGGGSSAGYAVYRQISRSVPAGGDVLFDFALAFGDPLLDLTLPTAAEFVAASFYVVAASVLSTSIPAQPGKVATVKLAYRGDFGTITRFTSQSAPMDTSLDGVRINVAKPWKAAAGDRVQVTVGHNDGAGLSFSCSLSVLKVA